MFDDLTILDIYSKNIPKLEGIPTRKAEFILTDLVGETIESVRAVCRGRNMNPTYLDVINFESGRVLVIGIEGWEDRETHHSFLVEPNRSVRYTGELFSEYK